MDPLTQASLGAAVAIAVSTPKNARMAFVVGDRILAELKGVLSAKE